MKTPAELAARLRKMVLAAQHHYSPTGEPLRSIVVTPEWLEDMADAANALDAAPVAPVAPASVLATVQAYGDSRADDDGKSAERIAECVTLLRAWAASLLAATPAAPVAQVCTYPDCNCPFDAPADPDWCARGLPHAAPSTQGCGITKI